MEQHKHCVGGSTICVADSLSPLKPLMEGWFYFLRQSPTWPRTLSVAEGDLELVILLPSSLYRTVLGLMGMQHHKYLVYLVLGSNPMGLDHARQTLPTELQPH